MAALRASRDSDRTESISHSRSGRAGQFLDQRVSQGRSARVETSLRLCTSLRSPTTIDSAARSPSSSDRASNAPSQAREWRGRCFGIGSFDSLPLRSRRGPRSGPGGQSPMFHSCVPEKTFVAFVSAICISACGAESGAPDVDPASSVASSAEALRSVTGTRRTRWRRCSIPLRSRFSARRLRCQAGKRFPATIKFRLKIK